MINLLFPGRKKPFKYNEKSIYKRLWRNYLGKNFQTIFQLIGALFIFIFVFSFVEGLIFHIVLAASIHMYTSILRSFFVGRFHTDIVQVLPWDLIGYKRVFFKWAIIGSVILLVPLSVFLIINLSGMNQRIIFFYVNQAALLLQFEKTGAEKFCKCLLCFDH